MQVHARAVGLAILALTAWFTAFNSGQAGELLVGAATESITPDRPVALSGQMRTRIAKDVESPVMATALALESRNGEQVIDQAIMVACDLVSIREGILEKVQERLKDRLAGFDVNKLFLSATHTHTAPVMLEGRYEIPAEGVMQPAEYADFLAERVAQAASKAWEARAPGRVGWGLGHAVVAHNRRATYADGRAQMYGRANRPDFRGFEGTEDHGVEVLFFWDREQKLIATAVNVACPAQEVEGLSAVNADFWHQVRTSLQEKHGKDLHVLGWTGAAGDQSPHLQYRQRAEERMRQLRKLSRLEEVARRIVQAWEEAYEGARQEMHDDVVFKHVVKQVELQPRLVTQEEYLQAQTRARELAKDPAQQRRMQWHQAVVERFEKQQTGSVEPYKTQIHVLRLGDVAIATNQFELFTDYGIQIKARSPALQTFIVQLTGPGTYLATVRAVSGGGYSAIIESNMVGPEGGQQLVDKTVEILESHWSKP